MGILTFGVQFNKKLAIGLNMKILHSNTGVKDFLDKNIGSNGVGIDLGIIYQINNEINIGFRIQNIINKSKWKYSLYKDLSVIEESYSINSPKVVTVGAKYDILEKLLFLLQVDVSLIPIIKNPKGLPINTASLDVYPMLFFTKFLLNAKLIPKKPPNKIKKTWHIKGIVPPAASIIYPPILFIC